jgi:inosine-uridine nucleoside N-ribohydrolase
MRKKTILMMMVVGLVTFGSGVQKSAGGEPAVHPAGNSGKIPVILDTDICADIDDTWALAMLLQSPEFDIKLITTAVGDTTAKTKVVAKMLQAAGRTDIPIGTGIAIGDMNNGHSQDEWVKDFDLSKYAGKIYPDGVQAMIDTIMKSPKPITLIAIGPLPNIAAALEREPNIVKKARFVGMHGSVRRGYNGKTQPDKEYNVVLFIKEAQKVFTPDWDITITPLDTCGIVILRGDKYKKVLDSANPLAKAVIENYRVWVKSVDMNEAVVDVKSTTLYDTVAIYLAMRGDLVQMENLGIRVTDDGYTVIDEKAKKINCATKWKSLDAFEDFLVERVTNPVGLPSMMNPEGQKSNHNQ